MPDLGKYAETVLSSYAVSILLILGLVVISIRRAKRMKTALQDFEGKMKSDG